MDAAGQQCMRNSAHSDIDAQNVTADHGQSIVFGSHDATKRRRWIGVMHIRSDVRKLQRRGRSGFVFGYTRLARFNILRL